MPQPDVLAIAAIVVLGVGAQWVAWRLNLPSILLLLVFGFVAGRFPGVLDAQRLSGGTFFAAVSIAVALILYEGGLTLNMRELRQVGGVVRNIVSIGALVSWVVSAGAARLIFGLDAGLSLLLGAILVVTGPTVIGPLLRHIRPSGAVGPILKWEGIVIDPIGAVLAVLVFGTLAGGEPHGEVGHMAATLLRIAVAGCLIGLAAGVLLTQMLHRHWVPDFLQNALSLMLVIAAFVGSNQLAEESGLVAATVMGVYLANQKTADIRHIVEFKENLRVLLISALFIVLAARLRIEDLANVGYKGALFVAALIFVARPLTVYVSTFGSKLKRNEKIFLAWMAPRGIVAAAVSSVFALELEKHNYGDEAHLIASITFVTIIATVAIYGLTAPLLARRLGVADSNPQGVLFIGAHTWARKIAEALHAKGVAVVLVDSNRENVAAARMAGMRTYAGSVLAEYAIDEIDLGGIGRVMALTPNDWVNVLAVQRFGSIFSKRECYQLAARDKAEKSKAAHRHLHGRWAFGESLNYSRLSQRFGSGEIVKTTRLTKEFDYDDFREMYGDEASPLFVIDESKRLTPITADRKVEPKPGQTLVALVKAERAEETPPKA